MKNIYMQGYSIVIAVVVLMLTTQCSKDLGNYDYGEINELEIEDWMESYAAIADFDTLRIAPQLHSSMDINDTTQYEFRWVVRNNNFGEDTIGRYQQLDYPVKLTPANYDLQYRVKDKETGVTFIRKAQLAIATPYTRGILLIGEDADGQTEAEMLSMVKDTLHIREIIKNSGIDGPISSPISFMYGGGYDASHKVAWILTESGSYYLDRQTMKYAAHSTVSNFLLPTDPIDVSQEFAQDIAPQIKSINGALSDEFYKVVLTTSGNIYPTYTILGAGYFLNPVNRTVDNFDELLPAAPYLMYPIGSMSSLLWYDTKNDRFMACTQLLAPTESSYPADKPDDLFSWNLGAEGRKLVYAENTFNSDGGFNNGNSFAVVRSTDNNFNIYKFHARGSNPVKVGNYAVKPIAQFFDQAEQYAFSSTRTVVFYTHNNKLYAYDYNPGNERFYTLDIFGNQEISMIKFDTQQTPAQNSLYVATYDAQTGGTLQRFDLDINPNTINLLPVDNAKWEGLIRVKDMNWKAERY